MKLKLIYVGTKPPTWIQTGIDEYTKRIPKHWHFEQVLVPGAHRQSNGNAVDYQLTEAKNIEATLTPGATIITFDEHGKSISTEQLATTLGDWQMQGIDANLIIGGADGLAEGLKAKADARWSLSALTLPHALARLLVVEQLYRAASLLAGHPYHRS
jgi:23S rRNA (pseudouridine1915-N3)-methyltransferase